MKIVGNKIYEVCADCGQIVCMNKWLFGSTHACALPDERKDPRIAQIIQQRYRANKFALDGARQ